MLCMNSDVLDIFLRLYIVKTSFELTIYGRNLDSLFRGRRREDADFFLCSTTKRGGGDEPLSRNT